MGTIGNGDISQKAFVTFFLMTSKQPVKLQQFVFLCRRYFAQRLTTIVGLFLVSRFIRDASNYHDIASFPVYSRSTSTVLVICIGWIHVITVLLKTLQCTFRSWHKNSWFILGISMSCWENWYFRWIFEEVLNYSISHVSSFAVFNSWYYSFKLNSVSLHSSLMRAILLF